MRPPVDRRLGLYAWGGPGTVELLKTKYRRWGTTVDERSFFELYEPEFLDGAKRMGVTDMWVTYSWGFSELREQEHRRYLRERLPQFRARGIRTHAYVQGLNAVTADFARQDIFCCDGRGRRVPYSAGRTMICPNNPLACELVLSRVRAACSEAVDGVFMDNIVFGMPPLFVSRNFTSFFGCCCYWCRRAFLQRFGYPLPIGSRLGGQVIADCLAARCRPTARLVADCAACCKEAGKQFGVNLYDPQWHTPELFFGYSLESLAPNLSYFLLENHALGADGEVNNVHLRELIATAGKPVFVVSYRYGIGCDDQWSQRDIDAIASEAAALGYHPCLKASEYITGRRWHALDIRRWKKPVVSACVLPASRIHPVALPLSTFVRRMRARTAGVLQLRLARWFFEADIGRFIDRRWLFLRFCRTTHAFTLAELRGSYSSGAGLR